MVSASAGKLDEWVWDEASDDYVHRGEPVYDEDGIAIPDAAPGISPEEFERLYPETLFRSNVASLLGFIGGLARLKSLDIDEGDMAFVRAMEVTYRRLLAGPNAALLKYLSNRDLVDLLIVATFAVPLAKSVGAEIKAKKVAAAVPQAAPASNEKGGDDADD